MPELSVADRGRRGAALAIAAMGAAMFLLYGWCAASYPPITGDVWSAELGAWRLATTGTPWIEDVDPGQLPAAWEIDAMDSGALWTTINPANGHRVVARSPGAVLAGVPAYAIQRLVDPEGSERLSTLPGSLTAAALTAGALVLIVCSVRRLVPLRGAIVAGLAVGITTPYWTVVGRDLWPHCIAVFGVAGLAWAASRDRWLLAGLFGGLGLCGRTHVAVIVAVVGVGLALSRREPRIALHMALTSLPFLAACSVWTKLAYDSWRPSGGYDIAAIAASRADRSPLGYLENLAGILVSPGYGLLVWTPAILLLVPAARHVWRGAPDWCRVTAVAGAVYLLIQVGISVNYTGGTGFWGYRLPLEALTCLIPILVLSARRFTGLPRNVLAAVVGLQGGAIALGALFQLARTNADGSGWRSNNVLIAFDENAVATLAILALGVLVALAVDRSALARVPASSPRAPAQEAPQ